MATNDQTKRYAIEDCPSREILFDALRLNQEERRVWVTLVQENGHRKEVPMTVTSIGVDHRQDNGWIVTGKLVGGFRADTDRYGYIMMRVSTNSRRGHANLHESDPRHKMYAAV